MKLKRSMSIAFLLYLGVQTAFAQSTEVRFLIDTSLTIMKNNAVGGDKVDWAQLRTTALQKAVNASGGEQVGDALRFILQSIGDFHGAFFYKDSTFKWKRNERPVSDSLMKEWKKGVFVKTVLLDSGVGYLRVPYMSYNGKEDADKNAQRLNDSLCFLLQNGVKGIVLDLRLNGVGAMYPMMLGLEQLLGTGKIGAFVSGKNEGWYIRNHNFLLDTAILTSLKPQCQVRAQEMPVVLLIGNSTGSSGEFLVMAFKGRDNTLFLGNETAGYVTAVGGFPINDAAYLYLSTGYGMDRSGIVYKEAIQPDEVINSPDSFNDIRNDKKVQAAAAWILRKSKE